MSVSPVVSRWITRWGASAVPEPWSATVGSVSVSNSATPPVEKVSGLFSLAFTSTGVAEPSATMVWGSVPVEPVRPSPR